MRCRAAEKVGLPTNPARGIPLPGGIYAAPTNEIYVSTKKKRFRGANARGPYTQTNPFFGCDGVWYMRRGGNRPLPGRLLFILYGRAGVHARRTL